MKDRITNDRCGRALIERLGLGTFALGAGLDLAYHLSPGDWLSRLSAIAGPDGSRAHEITLIGMVLVLVSLVQLAVVRALQSVQERRKEAIGESGASRSND